MTFASGRKYSLHYSALTLSCLSALLNTVVVVLIKLCQLLYYCTGDNYAMRGQFCPLKVRGGPVFKVYEE